MNQAQRVSSGAVIAVATLITLPATAQDKSFYLDRIQISGAPEDGYAVWRPKLHEKTRFYGSLSLGYSQNPLRKTTVTDNAAIQADIRNPVANQFITYLGAGAEIAGRVGVSAMLPVGVLMLGHDPAEDAKTRFQSNAPNAPLDVAALHDLRLDVRLPLYHSDSGKFHWGIGGAVWLPIGASASFAGDGKLTDMIYTNIEYDLGRFFLSGFIGPQFRGDKTLNNSPLVVTTELRWAFGGYMPLRNGTVRLGMEFFGNTGLTKGTNALDQSVNTFFSGKNTDLEWLAQGRFALDKEKKQSWLMAGAGTRLAAGYGAPDFRLLISLGYWFPIKDTDPKAPARVWAPPPEVEDKESDRDHDGFPDTIDKCPDIPEDGKEPDPSDGCPVNADRDGDGIPDDADRCPDVPEDKDGIEDADGCPETDADHDDIPDGEDKCPTEPGPASKIAEKHGCPSLTKFDETTGEIQLLEPIQFEYNSSAIKAVSFPILDEVVTFMKSRKDARLGVYGHTDSRGSDEYNLRLSKSRARACLDYLSSKGITASRLESEGFGETKPKCNEENEECWRINRRTEFKLLDEKK